MKTFITFSFCALFFFTQGQNLRKSFGHERGSEVAMAEFSQFPESAILLDEMTKQGYCLKTDNSNSRYIPIGDTITGDIYSEFVMFRNKEKNKSATAFINYASPTPFIAVFFPSSNDCTDDAIMMTAEKDKDGNVQKFFRRTGAFFVCAFDTLLYDNSARNNTTVSYKCTRKFFQFIGKVLKGDWDEVGQRLNATKLEDVYSCGSNLKLIFSKLSDCAEKSKLKYK